MSSHPAESNSTIAYRQIATSTRPTKQAFAVLTTGVIGIGLLALTGGCQQAGGGSSLAGGTGAAPITQLPSATASTGPGFTLGPLGSLGSFGGTKRVPPPATGSYGATAPPSASFSAPTGPASYAPSGVVPMSYQANANNVSAVQPAGGTFRPSSTGTVNSVPSQSGPISPTGLRSGGMPVIDMTMAPPPPGYRGQTSFSDASYPENANSFPPSQTPGSFRPTTASGQVPMTNLMPGSASSSAFNTGVSQFNQQPQVNHSQPFGQNAQFNSSSNQPAANQPAFSTADGSIEWQAPRY